MGCTTGIVKTLVFIFNLACAIVGIILLTFGSLFYISISKVHELTNENFTVAPSLVIAVGVIIFIISFLGCCGICRQSSCMLITYAVILLLLLIVQLVAGVYGFIQIKNNDELKDEFKNHIRSSMDAYDKNGGIKDAWDSAQNTFDCCGVESPYDWITHRQAVPPSCCKAKVGTCAPGDAYQKGCYTQLYDTITNGVKIVSYLALGIAAVEFLGALFAIYLVNAMKRERRSGYM